MGGLTRPVSYHISADRRTVYEILSDGSRRKINVTAEELEAQVLAAREQQDRTVEQPKIRSY